jgi:hypothetical protein
VAIDARVRGGQNWVMNKQEDSVHGQPAPKTLLWFTLVLGSGLLYLLLWQTNVETQGYFFRTLFGH